MAQTGKICASIAMTTNTAENSSESIWPKKRSEPLLSNRRPPRRSSATPQSFIAILIYCMYNAFKRYSATARWDLTALPHPVGRIIRGFWTIPIIRTLIKAIVIVLLIPIIIFILFHYLEKNYVHAWVWATVAGIGNLLLMFFSPNRKIGEGIKMLGFFSWISIIFISLVPILSFHDKDIV